MPVTNYYTVNGEIIAEHTVGQSRLDYITDGLGSVVSTVVQTLAVQSTARYKPYWVVLASTGTHTRFGYVGAEGYRGTGLTYSDLYVRMRHYSTIDGRWTTVDLLWPQQLGYAYADGSPTVWIDFLGTEPLGPRPRPLQPRHVDCVCGGGVGTVTGYPRSGNAFKCLQQACSSLCKHQPDPFQTAIDTCSDISDCNTINSNIEGCDSGVAWETCGRYFTVPGAPGWNGANANSCSYPKPCAQLFIRTS